MEQHLLLCSGRAPLRRPLQPDRCRPDRLPASPRPPTPLPAPPMFEFPSPGLPRATSFLRGSTPLTTRTATTLPRVATPARPPLRPAPRRGPPSCCRARPRDAPATSLPPLPAVRTRLV